MRNSKSEVVVITGASAGVGRATTRLFARKKARLALLARGHEGLEGARREVEALGGVALPISLDMANQKKVQEAAERIEKELGPIDIWINNAMVTVLSSFVDMTPEEFERVTDVTYLGTVWGTLAALRCMRQRNRGTIVQVGSALAYRAIPLQSAYCGAKHGVLGFTESLRCELLHENSKIRLSMVQLPALNTPQFEWMRSRLPNRPQPVPPIFQPEVAAEAIFWAAYHSRREVYVGMPTVKAIWADKIAPGLVDRYLSQKGYQTQQTDEPRPPGQADNLMKPVRFDFGAHGRFDAEALSRSWQLSWTKHRTAFFFAGLALGVLAFWKRLERSCL